MLLKRLYVLLYMELATRRVIWFAVTERPDALWVSQQARNLCWELSEIGVDAGFLIHARDRGPQLKSSVGTSLVAGCSLNPRPSQIPWVAWFCAARPKCCRSWVRAHETS